MVEASTSHKQCRRDRRRPARPRSRQRPDEARHERHRRASARHADGAPARSGRGRIAAQVAGRARHGVQDAGADAGDPGRGPRDRRALCRRRGDSGRSGRDGGRHPPQRRTRRARPASIASAASSSPTPCRPTTDEFMRSANACSIAARPTASSRRLFDQAKVCANHLAMKGFATYDGSVVSTKLKVTGHRPVLGRRFRAGCGQGRDRPAGRLPRRLQADHSARQEDRRRRALWRYHRRPLVLPASARRHRRFADARAAGVRRRQSRRRRP